MYNPPLYDESRALTEDAATPTIKGKGKLPAEKEGQPSIAEKGKLFTAEYGGQPSDAKDSMPMEDKGKGPPEKEV